MKLLRNIHHKPKTVSKLKVAQAYWRDGTIFSRSN